jgi:mono/diheme cytochrome c family protein
MIIDTAPRREASMTHTWKWIGPMAIWLIAGMVRVTAAQQTGWIIPPNAAAETRPSAVTDATIAVGRKLYTSKCERCHGVAGKGDGLDANPQYSHEMDLTKGDDAGQNPDGVVFYKIWNGRSSPRMPAFSEQISKDQAWAIVSYVQTLRTKGSCPDSSGPSAHSS